MDHGETPPTHQNSDVPVLEQWFHKPSEHFLVIYDGECSFCTRCVSWLCDRDRHAMFRCLPLQTADLLKSLDIEYGAASAALHVLTRDGERKTGAAAVLEVVSLLRGFRWLRYLRFVPGIMRIANPIYLLIANNRRCLVVQHEDSLSQCRAPSHIRRTGREDHKR